MRWQERLFSVWLFGCRFDWMFTRGPGWNIQSKWFQVGHTEPSFYDRKNCTQHCWVIAGVQPWEWNVIVAKGACYMTESQFKSWSISGKPSEVYSKLVAHMVSVEISCTIVSGCAPVVALKVWLRQMVRLSHGEQSESVTHGRPARIIDSIAPGAMQECSLGDSCLIGLGYSHTIPGPLSW